ncbi:MAG TPA: hypothetical protein ENJ00_01890 [Phycisphaerales bacterium]|nr:hypothetical protein [Phycisphaerales bacterium]
MLRPTRLFSDAQKTAVEDAIFDAEQRTGAEIVVAVAARSGGYRRFADVFALALAVVVLFAVMWMFGEGSDSLGLPARTTLHPGLIVGTLVATFFLAVVLADLSPAIIRAVAGRRTLRRHVERSAPAHFQRLRLRRTEDHVGLLIYISLLEHEVVIVPDDGILAALNEGDLDPIRETILDGMKQGRLPEALTSAIEQAGRVLGERLPAPKRNMDELGNELYLID